MIPEQAANQNWFKRKHPTGSGVLSVPDKLFITLIIIGLALATVLFLNNRFNIPVFASSKPEPMPVQISIQAIGVNAPIVNLGLNPDKTLAVPAKGDEVGWYINSAAPGREGASVLVGHLDWYLKQGVFWNLNQLKVGDEININRADGSTVVYSVTHSKVYSQDNFPTELVYGESDSAVLRLITCSGTYHLLKGRYSDNLIVFAELVEVFTN